MIIQGVFKFQKRTFLKTKHKYQNSKTISSVKTKRKKQLENVVMHTYSFLRLAREYKTQTMHIRSYHTCMPGAEIMFNQILIFYVEKGNSRSFALI